jgi:hypothetical protein
LDISKIVKLSEQLWRAIHPNRVPPFRGADPQPNAYWDGWVDHKDNLASSLTLAAECLSSLEKAWVDQNPTFSEEMEVSLCGNERSEILCREKLKVFFDPFVRENLEIDLGDSWYPHGKTLRVGFKLRSYEACILGYPKDPHYYYDDLEDFEDLKDFEDFEDLIRDPTHNSNR